MPVVMCWGWGCGCQGPRPKGDGVFMQNAVDNLELVDKFCKKVGMECVHEG